MVRRMRSVASTRSMGLRPWASAAVGDAPCSTSSWTRRPWPRAAAACNAVRPAALAAPAGAPASSSCLATSRCPDHAASCNGGLPAESAAFGSAPSPKRCSVSSRWPLAAAQCWGVAPSRSREEARAPERQRILATSRWPAEAATCSGVPPASFAASAGSFRLLRTSEKWTRSQTSAPFRTRTAGGPSGGTIGILAPEALRPAPTSSNLSTTTAWPSRAAQYRGDPGAAPLASTSVLAPASTRCARISVRPWLAAQCSGVAPCLSAASMSHPTLALDSVIARNVDRCPASTARCAADFPLSSRASMSASAPTRSLMTSA
mmetsp:Transcript_40192/g.114867  ORF Transcript_40192/g.114867 Transcript_40192/m.114867 type:complete len:319 (-) Transcript_40192:922-1878(-)